MANYLERQEILDAVSNSVDFTAGAELLAATKILNLIKWMPTADVVPAVRCKDCKHWKFAWHINGNMCSRLDEDPWLPTEAGDFCSYGERRNDAR